MVFQVQPTSFSILIYIHFQLFYSVGRFFFQIVVPFSGPNNVSNYTNGKILNFYQRCNLPIIPKIAKECLKGKILKKKHEKLNL